MKMTIPRKSFTILALIMIGLIITAIPRATSSISTNASKSSFGSAIIDGNLDTNYTCIYNATNDGGNFNVYLMNTADTAFFYIEGMGNFTIQNFMMNLPGMQIYIATNTELDDFYSFVFTSDRHSLEFSMTRSLVATNFNFSINGILMKLIINFFVYIKPVGPPEPTFGLSDFIAFLSTLAFAQGWVSVLFWVIFVIWTWRAMNRKIWILRKAGQIQGVDYGRWIKEELVNLQGTRLWRHTFKTDAAKTATVTEVYSDFNKEELIGKTRFKRINGFWLAMPNARVGTLKLRPDQYFPTKVFVKNPVNYLKKLFYYLLCWIPKLNDSIYASIKYIKDSTNPVKEIPFLYVTYAEDRVIEIYECSWQEKVFDKTQQKEIIVDRKADLTKEELQLLKALEGLVKGSLKQSEVKLKTHKFETLDEALSDKMAREELMANYRFKEANLNHMIDGLNTRLETTIDTLQNERRERVEEMQKTLDNINQHVDYLNQNMANYVGRAIGMHSIGVASRDIMETVGKEALKDFMQHSDEIKKKALADEQERVKELKEKYDKAKMELSKKTTNDIAPGEIKIEHTNDGGDD